jgi:D-glycero-D-manno-heptose 1,7-bisphosphate phosphatase
VFLDRDGTLIRDVHYLTSIDQIDVLPGVVDGLRLLRESFLLFVVTNQSGVARGLIDERYLGEVHDLMFARFASANVPLDGLYYCPHLPEGAVAEYSLVCDCRKPKPGMVARAAQDWALDLPASYLIGDRPLDARAGASAGVRPVLVGDAAGAEGTPVMPTFLDAAKWVLAQSGAQAAPAPVERNAR